MRRLLILSSLVVVLLSLSIAPAGAWVYVNDVSQDTGWQHYTYHYTGANSFSGYVGFVISNAPDNQFDSQLFIDHLSQASQGNNSFETGDFTGYTLVPGSIGSVVTTFPSYSTFVNYSPTDGHYFAALNNPPPYGTWASANTSSFINAYGQQGTTGSILMTYISLAPGETFSFDWAFCSDDYASFGSRDFSSFFLSPDGTTIIDQVGLGQLGAVPLPPSLLLLGSGLLGLLAFRHKLRV